MPATSTAPATPASGHSTIAIGAPLRAVTVIIQRSTAQLHLKRKRKTV